MQLQYYKERTLDKSLLDIYTDYLISSFSKTTATGLSELLDKSISHDKITRFLSKYPYSQKEYWQMIKPMVRSMQSNSGIMVVDDSILEKPYSDENRIVGWHYDHTSGKSVKGVNIISLLYSANEVSLPVAFDIIEKDIVYEDADGKAKRKSSKNKNGIFLEMLKTATFGNHIPFATVLGDSWFSSSENMTTIKNKCNKEFVFAIKSNRTFALSYENKHQGKFQKVSTLNMEPDTCYIGYLRGVEFPLKLCKQCFTNKDESIGELYLVSSDIGLDFEAITTIYQERWRVEEYHKSIKQNTALGQSPTHTVTTQSNHFFASIFAYCKLEIMAFKGKVNHFALKSKLYIKALKTAFSELAALKQQVGFV